MTLIASMPSPAHLQQQGAPAPSTSAGRSAAEEKQVTLTESERSRFDKAFVTLSKTGRVAIVAEGSPLHPQLSSEQARVLDEAIPPSVPVNLKDAVTRVADAFDYDVEQPSGDTFLLRKRYSDPMDIPYVTYAELVHALGAILQVTESYTENASIVMGDPRMDSALKAFVASLSAEQLQKAGTPQLVSSFGSEQRELAMSAGRYLWLGQKSWFVRRTLKYLRALKKPGVAFTWMQAPGVNSFAYRGPFGPGGRVASQPISNGVFTTGISAGYNWVTAIRPPVHGDPTLPTADDVRLAPGMLSDKLSSTLTLRDEAASIRADVIVDDSVADKPVTVFGAEYCDSDRLVRSLAALYGLKLLVRAQGMYKITLPTPGPPKDLDEVPDELARLVPRPLVDSQKGRVIWLTKEVVREGLPKIYGLEIGNTYYFPSMRRVVVLGEPLVPSPSSAPVTMTSANPEVYRLIAIAMLSDCMQSLSQLSNLKVPICFDHPEMMRFEAGIKDDRAYFSFDSGDAPARDSASPYSYGHMSRMEALSYPAR